MKPEDETSIQHVIATIDPIHPDRETVARIEQKRLREIGEAMPEIIDNLSYEFVDDIAFRRSAIHLGLWKNARDIVEPHLSTLQERINKDLWGLTVNNKLPITVSVDFSINSHFKENYEGEFDESKKSITLGCVFIYPKSITHVEKLTLEKWIDIRISQTRDEIRRDLLAFSQRTGIETTWNFPHTRKAAQL